MARDHAGDIVFLKSTGEAVRIIQVYLAPGRHDVPVLHCEIECGVRGSDMTVRRIVEESELATRLELFK